jgi:hypothetical protein
MGSIARLYPDCDQLYNRSKSYLGCHELKASALTLVFWRDDARSMSPEVDLIPVEDWAVVRLERAIDGNGHFDLFLR